MVIGPIHCLLVFVSTLRAFKFFSLSDFLMMKQFIARLHYDNYWQNPAHRADPTVLG